MQACWVLARVLVGAPRRAPSLFWQMVSQAEQLFRAARNGFVLGFVFRAPLAVIEQHKISSQYAQTHLFCAPPVYNYFRFSTKTLVPIFRACIGAGFAISSVTATVRLGQWALRSKYWSYYFFNFEILKTHSCSMHHSCSHVNIFFLDRIQAPTWR